MLSRAWEKKKSDCVECESYANTNVERRKKALFEVKDVPFQLNRETRSVKNINFSRNAHHGNVYEQAVPF